MQSEFKVGLIGYKKKQIEEYIKQLENIIDDYKQKEAKIDSVTELAKEQAELTISDAQKNANKIIAKAENEADILLKDAKNTSETLLSTSKIESDKLINEAYTKLYSVQNSIKAQRKLLDDFRKDYNQFILKYVNEINKRDFLHLKNTIDNVDNYISTIIKEAESKKDGYFVPNIHNDGSIIIVEPTENDITPSPLNNKNIDSKISISNEEVLSLALDKSFKENLFDKKSNENIESIHEIILNLDSKTVSTDDKINKDNANNKKDSKGKTNPANKPKTTKQKK